MKHDSSPNTSYFTAYTIGSLPTTNSHIVETEFYDYAKNYSMKNIYNMFLKLSNEKTNDSFNVLTDRIKSDYKLTRGYKIEEILDNLLESEK